MSFTAGIPASGQSLGSSRTQVQNNFSSLRTTISNATLPNHIDVNSTGAGKHIFIQMPVQTPSAANLTLSGEFGLIAKTANGISELFYNRDGANTAGTPNYIQLTKGNPSVATPGYSFLPGGILIQWGLGTASGGSAAITFPTPFPATLFSVVCTPLGTSAVGIAETGQSTTGFTAKTANSNTQFFWVALGN